MQKTADNIKDSLDSYVSDYMHHSLVKMTDEFVDRFLFNLNIEDTERLIKVLRYDVKDEDTCNYEYGGDKTLKENLKSFVIELYIEHLLRGNKKLAKFLSLGK